MKKNLILAALFIVVNVAAFAQKDSVAKKDTLVQITLTLNHYRVLLATIDQNIDSKKISKELMEFIYRSTQLVADKPKEQK